MAVEIDIVGQFSGKKAFKEADSAVGALTKSAMKLAGTLGVARLAQKAMLDAMADEKGAKVLAQNLKNLGMAFAQVPAEQFIKTMEKQTGILDDYLRPAYSQLARVTGSVTKTQEILMTAWNTSAGSGQDFSQVVDALSQAYVGNTKGLKSLNIGLTTAELNSKSFAEIQAILNKEFGGSGAASLDTYAGKLALLQVTAANASESLGTSLLDALSSLGGENGFKGFINGVESAVNVLGDLITGLSRTVALVQLIASPKTITQKIKDFKALQTQWQTQDTVAMQQRAGMHQWTPTGAYTPEQKKAEAAAKKRAAELLAQQKAANKLAINNAKLKKAEAVFDMKKIQITAALKSATDEATITRLQLMLAIENEQGDLADKLQKKLDAINEKTARLTSDLTNIQSTSKDFNPFTGLINGADLAKAAMDALQAKITETTGVALSNSIAMASYAEGIAAGVSQAAALSGARYAAQGAATYNLTPQGVLNPAVVQPTQTIINNYNTTVTGAIDPNATAKTITEVLNTSNSTQGELATWSARSSGGFWGAVAL